jgi:hypothetical protein
VDPFVALMGTSQVIDDRWHVSVVVSDSDGDVVHVRFFYRYSMSDNWVLDSEYTGVIGAYHASCLRSGPVVFWSVDVWDGQDVSFLEV